MTIRVRKGGVYDWTVPGPNRGKDSKKQRRIAAMMCEITITPRWDNRGRRQVHLRGSIVGYVRRTGDWRINEDAAPHGVAITGKATSVLAAKREMAAAL